MYVYQKFQLQNTTQTLVNVPRHQIPQRRDEEKPRGVARLRKRRDGGDAGVGHPEGVGELDEEGLVVVEVGDDWRCQSVG